MALVRMIPKSILTAVEPPISADDFRIRPYDLFGVAAAEGDMIGVIVACTDGLSKTLILE